MSDHTYYFEPFSSFIADGFRRGHLPLWNPYMYCGMAQDAVPSPGLFYPAMLLFVFLKYSQAVAALLCIHQFIAGCGAYLLVASLGWGVLAACVCGFAIALGGYMFALTSNYTLVATAAWIPLLFFAVRMIDRMWTKGNVAWMLVGSLSMFCMVAAGRPEIFFPAALLVVAYVVVTSIGAYREDRMPRRALMQAGFRFISIGLGCLLALPVVLPAVEWMRLSPRSHGLDLQWVFLWSANWYDLLGMLCAQPLGDVTILNSRYLNLVASRPNALPYISSAYIGPVIFTFALWSFFDKTWRWKWLLLVLCVGFTLMAAGEYTPLAAFICKLSPVLSAFRYPVKLLIFPVFFIALMAARGAAAALDKEVPTSAQATSAILSVVLILVGVTLEVTPQLSGLTSYFPWYHGKNVNLALMNEAQQLFGRTLMVTGGLGLLVNANYFAYTQEQLTKGLFVLLTGGTLLLTLFMPAVAYQRHGTVSDFYQRQHPLAGKLRQLVVENKKGQEQFATRVQPLYHDPLTLSERFSTRHHLDFQHSFYLFSRELLLPNINVDYKIPYVFGYEAAEEAYYKQLWMQCIGLSSQNAVRPKSKRPNDFPIARFCQMTSGSHVITQRGITDPPVPVEKLDPNAFTLVDQSADSNYRIYRVKKWYPRAYFAERIQWNAKQDDLTRVVIDDLSQDMLQDTFVEGAAVDGINDGAATISDTAVFSEDSEEKSELKVNTSTQRLLVVTDRLYPGWSAKLDGKPVPMRLVNFFARGVVIPPGAHVVTFTYTPISVWAGIVAACLVLLCYLVAWLIAPGGRLRDMPA